MKIEHRTSITNQKKETGKRRMSASVMENINVENYGLQVINKNVEEESVCSKCRLHYPECNASKIMRKVKSNQITDCDKQRR